jgi:hypothetical protein
VLLKLFKAEYKSLLSSSLYLEIFIFSLLSISINLCMASFEWFSLAQFKHKNLLQFLQYSEVILVMHSLQLLNAIMS